MGQCVSSPPLPSEWEGISCTDCFFHLTILRFWKIAETTAASDGPISFAKIVQSSKQLTSFLVNPLHAADFSAHPSRATEEFSQNNLNLTEQSLDLILAVIHLAYKKMIHKKFVQNLAQNSNLKRNVGKCERLRFIGEKPNSGSENQQI